MPNWTDAQWNAIQAENKNLIVSAGAGSGKTTVLTNRILKRVAKGDKVTDFLVVTFTKASAADLRKKLYEKLSDLLKKTIENNGDNIKHLRTQLYLLPSAHISTIHSFCLEIVRSNFQTLGISPRVRMADEQETAMIASEVMDTVIDAFYESDNELFDLLADTFSGQKDDGPLSDTMWGLYGKLRAYADYFGWLEEQANAMLADASQMHEGLFTTVIGKKLQARLIEWFDDIVSAADDLYAFAAGTFENANPIDIAALWRDHAHRLQKAVRKDFRSFLQAAEDFRVQEFVKLGFAKSASAADKAHYKAERDRIKKEIERVLDSFAMGNEATFAYHCLQTGRVLQAIGLFLSRFESLYVDAKRDKGVMDFADAEHYLYRLLLKDGKETALCRSLREQIKEIFIDEYQDVSPLQDELFCLLSRGNNRFMVGDVKQSIYRFRNAYPDIFLGYKDAFADYAEDMRGDSARIFLRENFRSGEKVLRFVNLLFAKATAGTPYEREYKGEELKFAKDTTARQYPVTVAVVPHNDRGHGNAAELEADYIAEEILNLIENGVKEPDENGSQRYRYRDIVLLFRTLKDATAIYEEALRKRGIPYKVTKPEPFFERPEILLMMAVLGAIDDPTDDISLFAAMRSPMFGFDADELYQLRMQSCDGSFYHSILHGAEQGSAKCKGFLDFLSDCREHAEGKACHVFLWELYTKSGILHLCTQKEKKGLMALYNYARSFEQTGYKGLAGFISYLNAAKEKGAELGGKADTSGDCVTLTTIHKSKGLEYPAVFVCATHKLLFGTRQSAYTLLRTDGLFFKLRDYERLVVMNTLPNRYAMIAERDAELGEELRKLYVACTRAREKLYITGAVSQKAYDSGNFNPRAPKCLLDIVLAMACGTASDAFELIEIKREEVGFHHASQKEQATSDAVPYLTERVKQDILFAYPHPSDLPAKVSVSALKETVSGAEVVYEASRITREPSFVRKAETATGAQRGTANHVFLQFCDFDRVCEDGTDAEIERLRCKRMMTEEQIALLDKNGLNAFFGSALFARMRASKRLYREQRFSVRTSAELFGGNESETVLLQGVIDCFFENEDGTVTVVDYKTDRVTDGAQLRERHAIQLQCYRDAVHAMTGKPVQGTAIWSFCLNQEV